MAKAEGLRRGSDEGPYGFGPTEEAAILDLIVCLENAALENAARYALASPREASRSVLAADPAELPK